MRPVTDPEEIARDFAEIPFPDHEARILALAYLALIARAEAAEAEAERLRQTA